MTLIATGVFKQVVAKKQSALGTKATASGAQTIRRVKSSLDLNKATYQSSEIRTSQQRATFRHGMRSVSGSISGELSAGSYAEFMSSLLRKAFSTAVTTGGATDISATAGSGVAGTFDRTTGSFVTDGFKAGMVVRASGFSAGGAANNDVNFFITSVSALSMAVVSLNETPVTTVSAGDTVTIAEAGKHCYAAQTGHTRDYWTIEHWFSDIAQSEVFVDCVISRAAVKMPPTGMITVDFGIMGLSMDTGTSAHFTSPAAAPGTEALSSANGGVYIDGVQVGLVSSIDFTLDSQSKGVDGIVGRTTGPDIFRGTLVASGNVTVLFADAAIRDKFLDETVAALTTVFVEDNTDAANFQVHGFPRVKFGGAPKDDGETGLMMTLPFTALEETAPAAGKFGSTYFFQDSNAA